MSPAAGAGLGDWRGDVLRFWFGLDPKQWWTADPALDLRIKDAFGKTWAELRKLPASSFLGDALTALAAVILFDQFPRNMFRGDAEQFATDLLALAVAKGAVESGLDEQLEPAEGGFLYMPFQHSEVLEDQNLSVLLFSKLGDADFLRFANNHREVIVRFGRFPHRNSMLGRSPRADEVTAGDVFPW